MSARASEHEISELAKFAEELADISGRAILPHFRTSGAVVNKHASGGFDPVTEADREAERAIRARIRERYPTHGILGEEFGHEKGESPFTWVLDPVDGTRAFMCGMAQWGTLIALNDGVGPAVGVMDQPFMHERWVAANGRTMFKGPAGTRVLKTRMCGELRDATLSTTSPEGYFTEEEASAFRALSRTCRLTRYGGDCYAYGLLAMGQIDVIVEAALKPWDVQALIPVVENAGGLLTDWDGSDAQQGGRVLACGDPALHAAVMAVLAAAR